MEYRPDHKLRRIHEHIRIYFDFLFTRGFQIVSALFIDQNYESWQVIMLAQECLVKIYSNKGDITLTVSALQSASEINLRDLVNVLQHANGGNEFFHRAEESQITEMQRLKRTAGLLENYIDGILIQIQRNNLLTIQRLLSNHMLEQNRVIV
jgi:hypothetical protein